jgi:hypothetical protein
MVDESVDHLDFFSIVACAHWLDDDFSAVKAHQHRVSLVFGEGIEIKEFLLVGQFALHAGFGHPHISLERLRCGLCQFRRPRRRRECKT